jgi:DNA-binding transcriptional MerR regulator
MAQTDQEDLPSAEMTIDELARRSGVTSRNIRAYQERGLLPPPKLVGRVGHYGPGHLARLEHINQLSDRGFSLASIRELFRAWEHGYGLEQILGFEQALAAPWDSEGSIRLTLKDFEERFGLDVTQRERAERLGILVPDGDDGYRVPSPRLLDAGTELIAVGVPLDKVLDEAERLRADLDRVAIRFINLYLEHVWAPFEAAGRPPEQLPHIIDSLNRLRPIANMAVGPLLSQSMAAKTAEVSARTLADAPDHRRTAEGADG